MDKNRRRNLKLNKDIPTADPKETEALIELLFVSTKENNAHCARLCCVSRKTWQKWAHTPPTEWYWPIVLRMAIKHTLAQMIATRRMTTAKFRRRILESLSQIPQHKDFEEDIANMAYDIRGSQRHLRDLLLRGGRWWGEIRLAANNGGYSEHTLRKAAKALGVVQTQEGYGSDKDSFWRLPNEDDD